MMNLTVLLLVASTAADVEAAASSSPFDLNTIISGGTGAGILGALYLVGKTVLDRAMPSRSDARASTQLVLESLNSMVKVLQEDKIEDSERLKAKQARIDELEQAADVDYDRIRELRDEILGLQGRLAQKDRHINTLVRELRRLGTQVTGLDLEDIAITQPPDEVRRIRTEAAALEIDSTDAGTPSASN